LILVDLNKMVQEDRVMVEEALQVYNGKNCTIIN
jgi:hypothetical protein